MQYISSTKKRYEQEQRRAAKRDLIAGLVVFALFCGLSVALVLANS